MVVIPNKHSKIVNEHLLSLKHFNMLSFFVYSAVNNQPTIEQSVGAVPLPLGPGDAAAGPGDAAAGPGDAAAPVVSEPCPAAPVKPKPRPKKKVVMLTRPGGTRFVQHTHDSLNNLSRSYKAIVLHLTQVIKTSIISLIHV